MTEKPRIARERRTIQIMIRIYCHHHHQTTDSLCEDCADLNDYAMARLDKCTFKEDKPTCKRCPVHCYRKEMRERVREVMIYAGPRMLFAHPLLAVFHLIEARKQAPEHPARKRKESGETQAE